MKMKVNNWVLSPPAKNGVVQVPIVSLSHFRRRLEAPDGDEVEEDLFKKLKFFLIIGRLLGVLPISGIFGRSYRSLKFSVKSGAFIFSVVLFAIHTFNWVIGWYDVLKQSRNTALDIAQSNRGTMFFSTGFLISLYFLIRARPFLNLFHTWAHTRLVYTSPDTHLKRDVALITTFVLLSAIGENAVLHLEYFKGLDHISGYRFGKGWDMPWLKVYFYRAHYHLAHFPYLPYHEVIAVLAFLQHKFNLYSWNYADIMIMVFARALHFKFKRLYELARERLQVNGGRGNSRGGGVWGQGQLFATGRGSLLVDGPMTDQTDWIQLVNDHNKLCGILQECEDFFSPVIFGSYFFNLFYICMQILDGITEIGSDSLTRSIYASWSFTHLILRTLLISIAAARINTYAHKIRDVLETCPAEYYTSEVARLNQKVVTGSPIGLTGLGAFTITKPFILNIVSVVFTFEIVLLQGIPPPKADN